MHAQFALRRLYFGGQGVDIAKKRGANWIKKSKENGFEVAEKIWNEEKYFTLSIIASGSR
jgi:TPR repeat protein